MHSSPNSLQTLGTYGAAGTQSHSRRTPVPDSSPAARSLPGGAANLLVNPSFEQDSATSSRAGGPGSRRRPPSLLATTMFRGTKRHHTQVPLL